jgi:hypothetical protein
VRRGSIVLLSQWVMHRDPRFFPDPERFDPDRWTDEARAARPRLAYFPFGAGPRICLGEQFAWMEGVLVLATLARRWRARLAAGQPVALQPSITLRPAGGMRMMLDLRAALVSRWKAALPLPDIEAVEAEPGTADGNHGTGIAADQDAGDHGSAAYQCEDAAFAAAHAGRGRVDRERRGILGREAHMRGGERGAE